MVSQHGTAGSGPHLTWVTHDGRAEPPYGRSRPWPAVSRTSSPQSIWGWTSTATRSRWGSSPQTSRPPRSTGFPTTSRRCAGSSPASVTPPAASLRRGRPHRVRARPAACPRGRRLPGGRAVADPTAPGGPGQDRYQGLPPAHCGCTAPASWSPSASPPSPRKRFGTRAAPAPTWSPTAPARGTGWASSCCATAAPGAAERAPGPTRTNAGCSASGSTNQPLPPPPRTTGRSGKAATRSWTPSRPTLPAGTTGHRSAGRSPGWPPTAAWPSSAPHAGRRGRPAGAASRGRAPSWASAGWCQASCSSGQRTWRGQLTKAGNAHLRAQLVESAWSYQHRPAVGAQTARRQQGLDPTSSPVRGRRSCGCAAALRRLPRPQGLQEPGRGRDRPRARRVLVGRGDRLSLPCQAAARGRARRCADPYDAPGRHRRRLEPRQYCARRPGRRRSWSGAPSCGQPTCGPNPRTPVWWFADPPCPGASCPPHRPATTKRVLIPGAPASTSGLPGQSALLPHALKPCHPPGKTLP